MPSAAEATDDRALHQDLVRRASALSSSLRNDLQREWLQAARFEHASIAAFNRFSMELLVLGAPADLLLDANRAALEEVEHARACFGLASAYAGQPLGPGPLNLNGVTWSEVSLLSAAAAAAEEGCVGEALAAAEVAAALERAEVPLVVHVLSRIAREEQGHAALSFRFVRWAIEIGGDAVRTAAQQAFNAAVARYSDEVLLVGLQEQDWSAHGRLPNGERRAVRQQALREIIQPAGRELFGT